MLFNDEINELKAKEMLECWMPNPIIFSTVTNPDQKNDKNYVRFEIDGTSQVIEAKYIWKREEEFFTFIDDFEGEEQEANKWKSKGVFSG